MFAAVSDVGSWWSGEIDGCTDELGAQFTYRHQDVHRSTQRITELVPGRRVVWNVTDSHLSFVTDTSEWTGTDIIFDITPVTDGTQLTFTHVGLVPRQECFGACEPAWSFYIATSLRNQLATAQARNLHGPR